MTTLTNHNTPTENTSTEESLLNKAAQAMVTTTGTIIGLPLAAIAAIAESRRDDAKEHYERCGQ